MKHTFRYILSIAVLLIPALASAQALNDPPIYKEYNVKNGVATGKSVSDPEGGYYTVTLETFATGLETIVNKAIPSDIVLVLDYSSSMCMPGNVTANPGNDWYNGTGTGSDAGIPNIRDFLYSLKIAVGDFVTLLKENNDELDLADGQIGNRLAVVLYAGQLYGSTQPNQSGSGNFYARHLSEFIPVSEMTVVNKRERHPLWTNQHQLEYDSKGVMYDGIDILSPSSYRGVGNAGNNGIASSWDLGDVNKGTRTGDAMTEAARLARLNTSNFPYTERSTTVVLFTDGEPSRGNHWSEDEANLAIRQARGIKSQTVNNQETDSHVKVFTVGLLNNPGGQMKSFLEYVSSDFSPASEFEGQKSSPSQMPDTDLDPSKDYGPYSSIVSEGANLSKVFQTIAESSGGSNQEIPRETQVVDVVSNSFEVPDGFDASQVKVYYREINKAGTEFGALHQLPTQVVNVGNNPPMTVQQPDDGKIGVALVNGQLTVLGFNFSQPDEEDEDGTTKPYTGNWVGWRGAEGNCAGKELVIEFKIEGDPAATGGDATSTNKTGSGVYVPIFNDDHTAIIGYDNVNSFEVPHKDLPINLVITKSGLRHGESATIQIYYSKLQKVDNKYVYNPTTQKPLPEAALDDLEDEKWENFSKVILTNLGNDGEDVTKTLLSLDPGYVYMLVEDDWGWAYDLDQQILNTCTKEKNPFIFVNREKTDAVKHAEAVSVNHFGAGAHAETAKSSKGSYFTPPTTPTE